MPTPVKYFHSAMSGAPTLNGTAGAMLAVLDACLVNGFNLKTADSIVVTGGIATVTISAGIGAFEVDSIALISGATPAGLNGEQRILSTSTTTFTFDATGISDQTATGTIAAKLAPAGWLKAFSGTNLGAYKSGNVVATGMTLRVDDTGTTTARVVGYETMTGVSTGSAPFPTATQQSGGLYWAKANAADATARTWTVIADDRTFYLHVHSATSVQAYAGTVYHFGDHASAKSGDAFACYLTGDTTAQFNNNSVGSSQTVTASNNSASKYRPRGFSALGSSTAMAQGFESHSYLGNGYSGYSGGAYPNGPDNGLLLSRMAVHTSTHYYGTLRGMWVTPQQAHLGFSWRDKTDGAGALFGRKLLAVKGAGDVANTGGQTGVTFFDITGPWA